MLNRKNRIVSILAAAAAITALGAASAAQPGSALTRPAVGGAWDRPLASAPPASQNSAQMEIHARADTHDIWHRPIDLRAGQLVAIMLEGDGDTDLDLYVLDAAGELVIADLGPTDQALIIFRVPATGRYILAVENLGIVYNEFVLQVR